MKHLFKLFLVLSLFSITFNINSYFTEASSKPFRGILNTDNNIVSETNIKNEIIEKRTMNSKTFKMDNGSLVYQMYSSPIHYEDQNGLLRDISLKFIDEADIDIDIDTESVSKLVANEFPKLNNGTRRMMDRKKSNFRSLQTPFNVEIPKNIKEGYSFSTGEESLTFIPLASNNSKAIVDNLNQDRIIFSDSWFETDIILDLLSNGLKETIVLKSPQSPTEFTFEIHGNLDSDFRANSYQILPPWLIDSNGIKRDVKQTLRYEGGKSYIDLVVNTTGLSFPINVDPTVVLHAGENLGKDTMISPLSNTNYGEYYEINVHSGSYLSHVLVQFPNLSTLKNLYPNHKINSASLNLFSDYTTDAGNLFNVHQITSSWEEDVTWSNRPSFNATPVTSFRNNIDEGWYNINVKSTVEQIHAGTQSNNGWLIKSADETIPSSLYFLSSESQDYAGYGDVSPKLTVVLESDVNNLTPHLQSPIGTEVINGVHIIRWSNPSNNANLRYEIQLSRDNGSTWITLVNLTSVGALSFSYDFSYINSTNNAKIRMRSFDGSSYSPYVYSNRTFTINNLEPNENELSAINLQYDTRYETKITSATDVDFYKFTAPFTGMNVVGLQVPNVSTINYDIDVYNSNMEKIIAGTNSSRVEEDLKFPVIQGEIYYIKVYSKLGYSST